MLKEVNESINKSYLVVRNEDVYEEEIIHRDVICVLERFNSLSEAVNFIKENHKTDYYIIERYTV